MSEKQKALTIKQVQKPPINDEISKYDRGKANLETLMGKTLGETQSGYAIFAPIIEVFLVEHLFADMFDRNVLTLPNGS